jgi:hypothetical protein
MHYRGIMDSRDADWYDTVLKECSSLDINDFLHDVSPYVTNRPLPLYRAVATVGGQGTPSTFTLPVQLVETDIFEEFHETRLPRIPNIQISVGMSRTWTPLLGKAVGDSTNSGLWRELYLDLTSLVIQVRQHCMVQSRYSQVEDTSHNSGEMLVHPDPLMSRIALGFRGSYRKRGARCARKVVICIRRMCHPLHRSEVVTLAQPMNCLRILGLVILPLMRLVMLMLQLLFSKSRTKTIVHSQNVVQWSWTMRLQGWICSLMRRPLPGLPLTLHLQLQLLCRLQ